jgi:anti-sigma B factor antagonist
MSAMKFLGRRSIEANDPGIRAVCQDQGGECQVSVAGRLTIDSSPDFRALLLKRLQSPDCRSLIVDFYDVPYVDTSGIATLVEILKTARGARKAFSLTRLQERPRYLMETTRLLHLFEEVNSGFEPDGASSKGPQ